METGGHPVTTVTGSNTRPWRPHPPIELEQEIKHMTDNTHYQSVDWQSEYGKLVVRTERERAEASVIIRQLRRECAKRRTETRELRAELDALRTGRA
jgi:hypothetical protein